MCLLFEVKRFSPHLTREGKKKKKDRRKGYQSLPRIEFNYTNITLYDKASPCLKLHHPNNNSPWRLRLPEPSSTANL